MVAAVAGAVGIFSANRNARKARSAQKRATRIQGKRADLENARQRRQQVAQARRLRAQATAEGVGSGLGTGGTSTVAGVQSSIGTQAATNVAFLDQLQGLDKQRFAALDKAADAGTRASTFQALGRLAGSGAGQEAIGAVTSFFKS